MTTDSPAPLATSDEFNEFGSFDTLVRDFDPPSIDRLMVRATRAVESDCDRRLAPFTVTESCRADGIDPVGPETGGWPLDMVAALGKSQAMAYGDQGTLVRDIWLNEYAPVFPDMWAYSGVSAVLARSVGGTQNIIGAALEGPEPDTGHFRFALGTWLPAGTTVRVTYSGGYQTVPDDLNTACILKAAKLAMLSAEPQTRKGMGFDYLDAEIAGLLTPWVRDGAQAAAKSKA